MNAGTFRYRSGLRVHHARYDAENRLKSSTLSGYPTTYSYDGLGRRVTKTATGITTVYVYGPHGQLVAEYRTNPTGTPAVSGTVGLFYVLADALGSTRLLLSSDGAPRARLIYLPFGEPIAAGTHGRPNEYGHNAPRMLFTGKEQDAETGLDYFESRYFSSAQGRFTSPDAMLAKKEWLPDPQRWNRYAYVRNNPLRFVDPNREDLVAYYWDSTNLAEEQGKWLNENRQKVLDTIRDRFTVTGQVAQMERVLAQQGRAGVERAPSVSGKAFG